MLLCVATARADESDIVVNISAMTVTKSNDPNYSPRCALIGKITNNSKYDVELMEIYIHVLRKNFGGISSHSSRSIFVGGFPGECKDIVELLVPKAGICRFSSDAGDCRDIVKFIMQPG
jgi:hypothetical protein